MVGVESAILAAKFREDFKSDFWVWISQIMSFVRLYLCHVIGFSASQKLVRKVVFHHAQIC